MVDERPFDRVATVAHDEEDGVGLCLDETWDLLELHHQDAVTGGERRSLAAAGRNAQRRAGILSQRTPCGLGDERTRWEAK